MRQASFYRSIGLTSTRNRTTRHRFIVTSSQASSPPPPPPASSSSAATTTTTTNTPQLPRVVLKGGKSKLFTEGGNPIVFSGAIDRVVGRPTPSVGDPVLVQDGSEKTIAWGLWNPTSMFRVRIMESLDSRKTETHNVTTESLPALLTDRIRHAVELRRSLGLPSSETNVYRLCNSEGDGLSGLVVDVLGEKNMVVSSSAAWVERYKERIIELLKDQTGISNITWRAALDMLAEEGWPLEQQDNQTNPSEDQQQHSPVEIIEHGIRYLANPMGQKTGFYSDQREHRSTIRQLAAGKTVLDVCCFSGGFAISAAVGGATAVIGVDSSQPALELATQNAALNGVSDKCSFVKADAAAYMKAASLEGKQWDIVVLDPPKLAPNRKALPSAMRKYKALNEVALRLVRSGGFLMTCSCSGAVAQSGDFLPMVQAASKRVGRRVTVVQISSLPRDHTLTIGYPEGQYLTNVIVRVI